MIYERNVREAVTIAATTITLTADSTNATSIGHASGSCDHIVVQCCPAPDPLREFLAAMRLAAAQSKQRTEQALSSARIGLRTLRDDPGVRVPLPERSTARRRRLVAGRVCGGSNRYRVMLG